MVGGALKMYVEIHGKVYTKKEKELLELCDEYGLRFKKDAYNFYYIQSQTPIKYRILEKLKNICDKISLVVIDEDYHYKLYNEKEEYETYIVSAIDLVKCLKYYYNVNLTEEQVESILGRCNVEYVFENWE